MGAHGMEPHMLMMSATPIPRTLAMSYYADLDVSVIDELPPGRTPIVTKLIADSRKDEVIERIGAQVEAGRQVYWVCPLIEESEALDLSNATATHADLSEALPGCMVGLLHSRMPTAEKKAVMALFTSGQMGVLVSTTVIEVGVDVPNASLMVIEHAERFGLKSAITAFFSAVGMRECSRPTMQPSKASIRSAWVAVALERSSASLSSISGHTQYTCRPASTCAPMRSITSSLRLSAMSLVTMGVRPGGSSSMTDTSRSA